MCFRHDLADSQDQPSASRDLAEQPDLVLLMLELEGGKGADVVAGLQLRPELLDEVLDDVADIPPCGQTLSFPAPRCSAGCSAARS